MIKKINILFQGWILMPHSYSIVLTYKLIFLYKNYRDNINFFIDERPYYNPGWVKHSVFPKDYDKIINNMKIYNGTDSIDLIYKCTYPYNLSLPEEINKKICVFYTSEFSTLDHTYFSFNRTSINNPDNNYNIEDREKYIEKYLYNFKNIYFTGPSNWSVNGLKQYNIPDSRNRMITHGVDTSIFYPDVRNRKKLRHLFNIKDDDILFMNIGALTGNKGISFIIQVMNIIINRLKRTNYKLLLKGIKELYSCKEMYENYFNELKQIITEDEMKNLIDNHIIFIDKTITYEDLEITNEQDLISQINMRDLYNIADVYISPYKAEGFNLSPLEAISCGIPIIIPITGSTAEYVGDIYNNGGSSYIYYIDSKVAREGIKYINDIDGNSLVNVCINFKKQNLDPVKMLEYIECKYSWNSVSKSLFEYFNTILMD